MTLDQNMLARALLKRIKNILFYILSSLMFSFKILVFQRHFENRILYKYFKQQWLVFIFCLLYAYTIEVLIVQ